MLSRIAESMFWIGRYVERASDVARVLEVNLDLGSDRSSAGAHPFGVELCHALGAGLSSTPTPDEVWSVLGMDPNSPLSMVSSLTLCRESARRAREVLSVPTWEVINRSYHRVTSGRLATIRPALACRDVHDFCAMIIGTLDETMTRDQAWHFLIAGRSIERIDMTARILSATTAVPSRATSHQLLLRACSAQQAFVTTRGRDDSLAAATDFLLRDRLFPRSVVHCLGEAREALAALDPNPRRTGFEDDAQRLLGRASSNIEYLEPTEAVADLAGVTHRLRDVCRRATHALNTRYFEGALVSQWRER